MLYFSPLILVYACGFFEARYSLKLQCLSTRQQCTSEQFFGPDNQNDSANIFSKYGVLWPPNRKSEGPKMNNDLPSPMDDKPLPPVDNDVINKINVALKRERKSFTTRCSAVGCDDFTDLVTKDTFFVDKSMFISDLLQNKNLASIITRPRRWGKSTNLDMLAKFFTLQVDKQGIEIMPNSHKDLFLKLKVGQKSKEIVVTHQGKYPVILFSFLGITPKNMYEKLQKAVAKLFNKYQYLKNSDKLNDFQVNEFKKYLIAENINKVSLHGCLNFLCEILHAHHGQKVFLFIDEYDAVLKATYGTSDYEEAAALMSSMFTIALKNNPGLKMAVITGVTKLAEGGFFTTFSSTVEFSILDDEYSQYFGFTENEVSDLLDNANICDQSIRLAIKKYYNGFQIGDNFMYNPWSMANFFYRLVIAPYWINAESSIVGRRRLSRDLLITAGMQETVRDLIKNCYDEQINENGERVAMKLKINPQATLLDLEKNSLAMWTILAHGGYLSLSNVTLNDDSTYTCNARIPNGEVLGIYKNSIFEWFTLKFNFTKKDIEILDIENMENLLDFVNRGLALKSDNIGDPNESVLHSFIEGLCIMKGTTHIVISGGKSGNGRIDSLFYPIPDQSDTVFIYEYKFVGITKSEDINKKIEEALWQVYENCYCQDVVERCKEHKYSHYKKVEIRGIVAFKDETTGQISVRGSMISHSIEDLILISPLFEKLTNEDLTKMKREYNISDVMKLFTKTRNFSFDGLLKDIDIKYLGKINIEEFSKVIGNSKLAKALCDEHGDKLFTMKKKELMALKGVGKKRALAIVEYLTNFINEKNTSDSN